MRYISIITGSDLRFVMGVNYFIKSLIQFNSFFDDMIVNRVYSGVQMLNIDNGDEVPIGSDVGSKEYLIRRGVRSFLRRLLTDRFYPFALFRYWINQRTVSKQSVERFFKDEAKCDFILFQEIEGAYYYFKHSHKNIKTERIKTALVIHSEDDSGDMFLNSFKGYGHYDMQRRFFKMRDYVYQKVDKVVYISQKAYNKSILPLEKRAFIYNGVSDVKYTFRNRKDNIFQFICVGSFAGRKGQEKIIEAMKMMDLHHLERMHMTFVGAGCKFDECKLLVKEGALDNYVDFLGTRNDVPKILQGMDVFIMPSTIEGLPMSAIEAMRAGLFLILTDTGGNAELCSEGCGLICDREPSDILSKMYQVMDGEIISIRQKQNSRDRFLSHFSIESMSNCYQKMFESL